MEVEAPYCADANVCQGIKSNGKVRDSTSSGQGSVEHHLIQASNSLESAPTAVNEVTGSSLTAVRGTGDDAVKTTGGKRVTNIRKNTLRKVKNITMGEIPLRPVGLSLSGSGMQLYVKVDNVLHKDQLANLESQFVAKICNASNPATRQLARRKRKDVQRQSLESSSLSKGPNNDDSSAANSSLINTDISNAHTQNCLTVRPVLHDEVTETNEDTDASIVGENSPGLDMVIKKEISGAENHSHDEEERDLEQIKYADSSSLAKDCAGNSKASNKAQKNFTVSRHRHRIHRPVNLRKTMIKKTKEYSQQQQDMTRTQGIQTNPVTEWAAMKPKAVYPNTQAKRKRLMPSVFTSNDLPLKRFSALRSCSSADVLIHQQKNNSGFFSPVRPMESDVDHAFFSTNNADSFPPRKRKRNPHSSCPSRQSSSKDAMSIESLRESAPSKYALVDTFSPDSNTSALPLPHQEASTVSSPGESSPSLQPARTRSDSDPGTDPSREEDNGTPLSCADFHADRVLTSGVVDAETLAKFAEYTSSMRRDLKQSYKKLSLLMKNFNQEVMEHYRDQANMDTSASAALHSDVDTTSSQKRCIVM